MNCYRHADRSAVAVCRNCGKAACGACCDETARGVACSQTCADEIRDSYRLKQRLKQSFGIGAPPPMPASVPTYTFFGLILLITGVYLSLTRPGLDFLTFGLAAAFFVMAGATYRNYRTACQSC
jgi:hypothetical protein